MTPAVRGSDDEWRVAFDVAPVTAQPAGIGGYARRLALALADLLGDRLALIGMRDGSDLGSADPSRSGAAFRSRTYHSWLQLRAARDARRLGARLAHYTNGAAPIVSGMPFVVTAHDMSLLRMPATHPLLRLATAPIGMLSLARARAIVVPSDFTRRELVHGFHVSPRRVTVIEHAPTSDEAVVSPAAMTVLERIGVGARPFLLYVGTIEPRKNLTRLVESFEILAATMPDLSLVIVGSPGWRYRPILKRIESSARRDQIVLAGYLPVSDVVALTRATQAVCYVSLYEGFGMPVLDAMALGAPVVTSNRTAMPQAAGGAAVLVDPSDAVDIARGIQEALGRRAELSAAGRARVGGRTWLDVAAEHVDVYRWALRTSDR